MNRDWKNNESRRHSGAVLNHLFQLQPVRWGKDLGSGEWAEHPAFGLQMSQSSSFGNKFLVDAGTKPELASNAAMFGTRHRSPSSAGFIKHMVISC